MLCFNIGIGLLSIGLIGTGGNGGFLGGEIIW
jgi:hypothetical protein